MPDARRLVVLGSTGSIGVNTLAVAKHLRDAELMDVTVVGIAGGRRADLLIEQARAYEVEAVAIADATQRDTLREALPGVTVFAGEQAAEQLVEHCDATDVMAAVVGSAGLPATMTAIRKGCRIGLANKETLVAAGAIVKPLARQHGVDIIPVDSEHSAIFQCLIGQAKRVIKRIVLTASGGPFRTKSKSDMAEATVEQALNHPTWKMGPKITIDSATMMNKALEVIEAHWLFDLPGEQIEVIVHPQSVIHSFVEFTDHSILAQLGAPDMKTPIQYALTYPDRSSGCSEAMDWSTLTGLAFEPPDFERFPSIKLAYDVIGAVATTGSGDKGSPNQASEVSHSTAGAVFNAANEAAVAAFLEQRIRFGRIVELVADALSAIDLKPATDLETILGADQQARAYVRQQVGASS